VHDMIDDINIPDNKQGNPNGTSLADVQYPDNPASGIDSQWDTIAERRVQDVAAIEECWLQEAKEPRFDTNLLEEKFYPMAGLGAGSVGAQVVDGERWEWKNIETLPWDYTEFVLPELPEAPGLNAMGDYILVSSFWTQDWFIGSGFVHPVRVKFQYDAAFSPAVLPESKSGIYVNTLGPEVPQVPTQPCDYDDPRFGGNANGVIDKTEVIRAIIDYFGGGIGKPLAIQVIIRYFGHTQC